jgi:hypothetical protein
MSYILNKTDGSILTEIVDGSIDQTATDLTLIGKNSSSYGEFLNENLIHILENFANTSAPNFPVAGQLWFDTSENRLKVYDGTIFKVSGGTIVAPIIPSSISTGDIWIDSNNQQMYFNDGVANILAGPSYTKQQGISGFQTIDVYDIADNKHTVVLLYVAQVLLGLFSKDAFSLKTTIPGITGDISVGFNVSDYNGFKFHARATMADALVDVDGNLKTVSDFITTDQREMVYNGTVTIQDLKPLILGPSSQNEIYVDNQSFIIKSNLVNQNFKINLINAAGSLTAITAVAATQRIGIYTTTPEAMLDVNGDVVIQGSLTVKGNYVVVNTTNLEIQDKLIELGVTTLPTNATADGGGISLAATINKTITYENSTTSWKSSEDINIPTGKTYKINGSTVLSSGSLGAGITSSSLTSFGALTTMQIGSINIAGSTVSYVQSGVTNGDVILKPKGTGVVNASSAKIINVADPVSNNDAVNLAYMNEAHKKLTLSTTLYVNGMTNAVIASTYLSYLFPTTEHLDTSICRAVCIDNGVVTIRTFVLTAGSWVFNTSIDIAV